MTLEDVSFSSDTASTSDPDVFGPAVVKKKKNS
jgi:hypothetical protein